MAKIGRNLTVQLLILSLFSLSTSFCEGDKKVKKRFTSTSARKKNNLAGMEPQHNLQIVLGQCEDLHPTCPAMALNGMCDAPSVFTDIRQIQQKCKLSCGMCKNFIPGGTVEVDNFDGLV